MPPKKKTGVDPDQLPQQSENGRERPNTFTFKTGRRVVLNRLGEPLLVGIMSETGKPKPPQREVKMAGGGVGHIDRAEDEALLTEEQIEAIKDAGKREEERTYRQFRLDLQAWEMKKSLIFARTLFLAGVVDDPTPVETELWRAIGWDNDYDIKYSWLAFLCSDPEDWADFMEAVMSFSMPTDEGLDEMQELFRTTVARQPQQAVGADLDVGTETETPG